MKMIRINDEQYSKLKLLADKDGRSMASYINKMIDDIGTVTEVKPTPTIPVAPEPFIPRPPDPVTGYPCCLNRVKRCKHWQWDNAQVAWSNSLTGEIIEDI